MLSVVRAVYIVLFVMLAVLLVMRGVLRCVCHVLFCMLCVCIVLYICAPYYMSYTLLLCYV